MYQKCKRLLIPERSFLCRSQGALAIITILCSFSIVDGEVTATKEVSLETNKSESNLNATVVRSSINQSPNDSQPHSHSIGCSQPHCQRNNAAKTDGYRKRRDVASPGRCETGWTLKGDLCYKLTAEQLSWSDAQNKCRSMNSLLVEVENSRQQDALHVFLNSQVPPPALAWIGLSNQPTGNWTWGSGRPMNYSKWLDSEPNNVGGVEHCVNVWPRELSSWSDYTCNTHFQGVCQKGAALVTTEQGSCESGWTFVGESCYKLTTEQLTWSDAQENCRSMNSLLVEIENSQEQEALNVFLNSKDSQVWSAWIGLSDLLINQLWIWSSGRPMNYSKWYGYEPNNLGGNEHCVNVWPNHLSSWNDYSCNATFQGVCQKGYCGSGWTSTRKSCYQLTDELTRNEAQKKCRSINGSLAEIKNSNEQDELHDFLRSQGNNAAYTWIGLSDPQKNRAWKWDSGSGLTYRNWIASEPNNAGGDEYCVDVWQQYNFGWNDVACSFSYPGVCKQNKDRRITSPLSLSASPSFTTPVQPTTQGSKATITAADTQDRSSTLVLSASISPSFTDPVQPTTLGSKATVTAANTQGCAVSSELCHTLSQRGLCANDLFKNYMDLQCRRACGRCS